MFRPIVFLCLSAANMAAQPCWPNATPFAAMPPATPIWCTTLRDAPATFAATPNQWIDDFALTGAPATIGNGYRVFERLHNVNQTSHFRLNDHWMVDVNGVDRTPGDGPWNFGGATMRPEPSFRFVDGKLIVEAEFAAGIEGLPGWGEIVVTTAPAPTGRVVDELYSYGQFGGHWTIGLRLQPDRLPIIAMYDNTGRTVFQGGRVSEMSFWQTEGARVEGGGPWGELDRAWRVCRGTDPDINCRDRFRWEITRDRLTVFVNGVKYMEHSALPAAKQIPNALLEGDVYVYFSSWIYKPAADTVRFHWDRLSVNPGAAAPPVQPLTITGLRAAASLAGEMLVTWRTNRSASCQLAHGDPRNLSGAAPAIAGAARLHAARLAGVDAQSSDAVQARCTDGGGASAVSPITTVRSLGTP